MTRTRYLIIGLGELLWDLFPDRGLNERRLGGAPANVAYHAAVLGDHGVVASRVGTDELGREALQVLEERGVDTSLVQLDPGRRTGTARVTLSTSADPRSSLEPAFEIDATAAWSAPAWTRQWEAVIQRADVLCFGTLLCSSPAGRHVVEQAAAAAPDHALRLLDLNLRPPFDQPEAIDAALACANLVKLSEEELRTLGRLVDAADAAEHLIASRKMRAVAVTRGARGSLLYTPQGQDEQPGVAIDLPAEERDPVGAGDAFTAALAYHLVRRHAPRHANAAANRYASFVASKRGATPDLPEQLRRQVVRPPPGPEHEQEVH